MRNHFLPALSITFLLLSSFASGCFGSEEEGSEMDNWEWVDPVEEIEDENHSHSDLMAHRLKTPNARMIDYHNLNCDGEVTPPADLDNVAGRPCFDQYKNVGPTPGDNSEIAIEGNFLDDCETVSYTHLRAHET